MEFEEDTYSSIFSALKHPARRKILRMLDESPATYTQILNGLRVGTGFLNYHLESLNALITKNEDGEYLLSEFGRAALALTTSVEAPVRRESRGTKVLGRRINAAYISAALMVVTLLVGAAIGMFVPQVHQPSITQTSMILTTETQMETTTAAVTQTKTVTVTETTHQIPTANPGHRSIYSPTIIDLPGTYVLSADIADSSAGTCIRIMSSDVILEGQGHTIDGLDTDETYGVHVYNPSIPLTNVTVKDLRVTDWEYGIYYRNTTNGCIATIQASSGLVGISLQGSSNHTVINNTVSYGGISLEDSHSNNVINNDINYGEIVLGSSTDNNVINNTLNDGAIWLGLSTDNNLINNTVNDGWIRLGWSRDNNVINNTVSYGGISLGNSHRNNMINNNIEGPQRDPQHYLESRAGIYLRSSHNNTFINNTATFFDIGIQICYSRDNKLIGNNASWNEIAGIHLDNHCMYNTLANNTCSNNWCGIHLHEVYMTNVLINNTANSNVYGIYLQNANSGTVTDNTVDSNDVGLMIDGSTHLTVTRNKVTSNREYGISLISSSGNMIYDNYFDNENNGRDDGENTWSIAKTPGTNIVGGAFVGGNFWSDYIGTDSDGDGLGDTRLPCDSNGGIVHGGDFMPLLPIDLSK